MKKYPNVSILPPVMVKDLEPAARKFLEDFAKENPMPKGDEGLAIFLRSGPTEFAWIKDAQVSFKKGGAFAKSSPPNLFRSGAGGFIVTEFGVLAVSDERGGGLGVGWYKPFPVGLAAHAEGGNLRKTFDCEWSEEVLVFNYREMPGSGKKMQYIPPGQKHKLHCEELEITLDGVEEFGELKELGYLINEPEKALEYHMMWNIVGLKGFSVLYVEDQWFAGGRPGIPVVALSRTDELSFRGNPLERQACVNAIFAGQQGPVKLPPDWNIHPSVANFLDLPAPEKRIAPPKTAAA